MQDKKPKLYSGEKWLLGILLAFFMCNLGVLFYNITTGTYRGVDINAYAEETTNTTEPIYAQRGKIYDVNGEVIATNTVTYDLVAILDPEAPNHVTDPEEVAEVLSKTCKNTTEEQIMRFLSKENLYQTELGAGCKNLTLIEMEYLQEHPVDGIEVVEKPNRYYPDPYFASPIIGYAKPNEEGQIQGEIGLEAQLDSELSGTDGSITYPVDQYGNKVPGAEVIIPAEDGNDVYLTIDARIQTVLESAVEDVWQTFDPKHIMAIVMDPDTGDIIAATARPTFNMNDRHDIETYLNPLAEMTYEPGSIMKAFLWCTAMSMGVYDGDQLYMSGSRTFEDGTVMKDWNKTGWGEISYDQGLIRSSNTAAIDIASEMVGYDAYYEQLVKLGFTEPVNVYGMVQSLTPNIQYEYETEKASVSFGQGMQVTALNVAQAFTAIASETGDVYQLNLVDKIVNPNTGEVVYQSEPTVIEEDVYTVESTQEILDLMNQVVEDPNGSAHGKIGNIPGYEVSVKTGTAQQVVNGQYTQSNSGYLYSALVAAPTDDPEVAMYVLIDQPQDLSSVGGASATPAVGQIVNPVLSNALSILGVEPDHPEELFIQTPDDLETIETPSYINMPVDEAVKKLEEQQRQYIVIGDGDTVVAQTPTPYSTLYFSDVVVLITNGQATVPSFIGMSQRDLERICNSLGITPIIQGSGYVKTQSIPPGTAIEEGMEIKFTLG